MRNESNRCHNLGSWLLIIASKHFVFSRHLIRSRLSGILVLAILDTFQDQVWIGRFDFRGGRKYL